MKKLDTATIIVTLLMLVNLTNIASAQSASYPATLVIVKDKKLSIEDQIRFYADTALKLRDKGLNPLVKNILITNNKFPNQELHVWASWAEKRGLNKRKKRVYFILPQVTTSLPLIAGTSASFCNKHKAIRAYSYTPISNSLDYEYSTSEFSDFLADAEKYSEKGCNF